LLTYFVTYARTRNQFQRNKNKFVFKIFYSLLIARHAEVFVVINFFGCIRAVACCVQCCEYSLQL